MVRGLKRFLFAISYYGAERYCPVCSKSSNQFCKGGAVKIRNDAQCPHCGSVERHRLLWLYLLKKTDLFNGKPKRMLHIAPEIFFEPRLRKKLKDNYLTADLFDPRAMIKMDITKIKFPDESFEVIYCSHVLEHVEEDKKAIGEIFRVLKKNGWAILLVPIVCDKTFEDFSISDPMERLKIYGHKEHVRNYGKDYVDRLREKGFKVEVITKNEFLQNDEIIKLGLSSHNSEIYYCTK